MEMSVCDHVHKDKCTDLFQPPVRFELLSHVAASIQAVSRRPLFKGLFPVEEHEPVGQPVPPPAKHTGHFEKKCGARAAVICSHEMHTIQPGGLVMPGEDQELGAFSTQYADHVGHGNVTHRRRGHKRVIPSIRTGCGELPPNVLSCPPQGLRTWRARAKFYQLL